MSSSNLQQNENVLIYDSQQQFAILLTDELVPQVLRLDLVFETAFHDVYTVVVARPKPRESLAGGARVHLLNGLETLFARLNIFHLLRDLEARLQGLKQQRTGKKRQPKDYRLGNGIYL